MRLLNVHTLELQEFFDEQIPRYIILSHRWGPDEVSYKAFRKGRMQETAGYKKIVHFRDFVRGKRFSVMQQWDTLPAEHGWVKVEWLWIDTCCIDKRSSAELSEAINSVRHQLMFFPR